MTQIWRDGQEREFHCGQCGECLYLHRGETVETAYERQRIRKQRARE